MQDIYELGCKAGLLNYIDHETPRVYFVHAHAELEDFEAFCKALVDDCDAEIERLREALEELLPHALFLLTQMEDGLSKDPKLLRDRIQKARAALKEKE